jgi:hypothetical protein
MRVSHIKLMMVQFCEYDYVRGWSYQQFNFFPYPRLSTLRYDIITTTKFIQGGPQESALASALHASSAPQAKLSICHHLYSDGMV